MAFSFGTKLYYSIAINFTAMSVIVLAAVSPAFAAGDAEQGQRDYDYTCRHCHGSPQPGKLGAFSDYDVTANRLTVYASDPVAITKAANEGYVIPSGNSNDDFLPGAKTNEPMRSFSGTGAKRFGTGTTPSTYAINISAYFASLFSVPSSPTIGSVTTGNNEAIVNFTAPKSDLTITSYIVTANPGAITATGTTSPIKVSGLTNGTAYTFTVAATSNAGSSKPSSASNSVTPNATVVAAAPSAPTAKVAPAIAVVPQPIAQIKATSTPTVPVVTEKQAKAVTPAAPVAPSVQAKVVVPVVPVAPPVPAITVATVKEEVTIQKTPVAKSKVEAPVATTPAVQAKASAPIEVHVPLAVPVQVVVPVPVVVAAPATVEVPAIVPAPTNVAPAVQTAPTSRHSSNKTDVPAPIMKMARAGNSSARVFFAAPADSPNISSYIVTALSDGKPTGITATGAKSPITITGLNNGSSYTFTVTAKSGASSSEASDQSNSVTPLRILGD
jgi:hypothetical protein